MTWAKRIQIYVIAAVLDTEQHSGVTLLECRRRMKTELYIEVNVNKEFTLTDANKSITVAQNIRLVLKREEKASRAKQVQ